MTTMRPSLALDRPPAEDPHGLEALAALAARQAFAPALARFLFLRHGRTAGNASRTYQHPDDPLSAEGFADAAAAARRLEGIGFTHIVASDMARAWLTAARVAAVTRKPVIAAPGLRERYFGDWIGTSSAGLDWRRDPPNGETLAGFVHRTALGLRAAFDGGGVPLLIAHGGTLRVLAGVLGATISPAQTANALPLVVARDEDGDWTIGAA